MIEDQIWIKIIRQISSVQGIKIRCPNCNESNLRRLDISFDKLNERFERLIICPKCNVFTSILFKGAKYYFGCDENLSDYEKKIIDDIKIIPVEHADDVLKIALTKELKRVEWVEVEKISQSNDKSQASIQ